MRSRASGSFTFEYLICRGSRLTKASSFLAYAKDQAQSALTVKGIIDLANSDPLWSES